MKNIVILTILGLAVSACSTVQTNTTTQTKAIECVAIQAAKLVGQSDLSEAKIKQLTQATIVRKVTPDQMMTMDYRVDRVTVTVDPQTKKIIKATCG